MTAPLIPLGLNTSEQRLATAVDQRNLWGAGSYKGAWLGYQTPTWLNPIINSESSRSLLNWPSTLPKKYSLPSSRIGKSLLDWQKSTRKKGLMTVINSNRRTDLEKESGGQVHLSVIVDRNIFSPLISASIGTNFVQQRVKFHKALAEFESDCSRSDH